VRLDEGRFPALELNNRRLSVKNSFCRKNGIYTRSVEPLQAKDTITHTLAIISGVQLTVAFISRRQKFHLIKILLTQFCLSFLFQLSVLLMILTGINNVVLCAPLFPHNSLSFLRDQTEPRGARLLI